MSDVDRLPKQLENMMTGRQEICQSWSAL